MGILVLALLLGVITGLRAMTGFAAVSWAAHLHLIDVSASPWLAWLGYSWTPWIGTLLAIAELVSDQLPATPSRKVPVQFGTRIVVGALVGAATGYTGHQFAVGALVGAVGAVIGTLGGAAARSALASAFGNDRPAALIEDLVAVGGAALIVCCGL